MRHLALIVAIACAMAVATFWAIRVPIFQQPDELAHADYVFALYDAGGPFYRPDPILATDVTRQAVYLAAAVGYRAMRYNPYARVAPAYGTGAYFRALDARAPSASRRPPAGRRVPYVAGLYPAGYYALAALAMVAGSIVGRGSLLAGFFAARLLDVALLGVTLVASYAIFRRSGLSQRTSVLAVTAVGFFPMTAWVAGYVQPDDLVAALFAVALAVSLGPRATSNARRICVIGLLVAAAMFVKTHYALALWLAIVPSLAARIRRDTVRIDLSLLAVFIVGLPLAAYEVATTILNPVRRLISPGSWVSSSDVGSRLPTTWLARTAGDALHAFDDAYFGGVAGQGFWLHFGMRSGMLFPEQLLSPLRYAIVAATVVILGVFAYAELRMLRRLATVARRRSLAASLRLGVAATPLSAYLIVSIMLVTIGGVTHGGLVLQGRYWLPVMAPLAVLLFVGLPKLARPASRARLQFGFAAAAASYSIVAAAFGVAAVGSDFYHAPRHRPSADSIADIRRVSAGSRTFVDTDAITIARDEALDVSGYAVDMRTGLPARNVVVSIDGRDRGSGRVGRDDREVATTFNDDAIERSGFDIRLAPGSVESGTHVLRCYIAGSSGRLAIRRAIRLHVI